jgi:hypothetical protein
MAPALRIPMRKPGLGRTRALDGPWRVFSGSRRALTLVALAVTLACGHAPDPGPVPGTPADLEAYLRTVAGADPVARAHEVASWVLDEAAWNHTVVEPWRAMWPDYARGFDAAIAPLAVQLVTPGEVTARRHWAGDPRLTAAQARLRWVLPVQYPSAVAEIAGRAIDTVFVYDGARWRALAGVDELLVTRIRARDPECAALLARVGPPGRCTEVGWLVADSGWRADASRFAHACRLARVLCGNASP